VGEKEKGETRFGDHLSQFFANKKDRVLQM
jgi:hypothetical protein